MTFYTDENLAHALSRMIRHFDPDNRVIPHCRCFKQGIKDEDWIPAVAAWIPKPAVVLGDGRILRNPQLKRIAKASQLSFVVMGESFMETAWNDQAWKFVKMWPAIVKAVSKAHGKPMIFDVKIKAMQVEARHATAELKT